MKSRWPKIVYNHLLEEIESNYLSLIESVAHEIAQYDVWINKAYIAREYKYCRPHIQCYKTLFRNADTSFVLAPDGLIDGSPTTPSLIARYAIGEPTVPPTTPSLTTLPTVAPSVRNLHVCA